MRVFNKGGAARRAPKLEPNHADAHIALGAFHAEVIDKVGAMVGGLTYGAKKDAAVEHFEKALKLPTPPSPASSTPTRSRCCSAKRR